MKRMRSVLSLIFFIPSLAFAGGQLGRDTFGNDDVIGVYHLNENAGTAVSDSSGKQNDGTVVGACVWVTGKFASAITCNASTRRIDIENESAFDFGTSTAFYVVILFKVTPGAVSGPILIGKTNSSTQAGWRLMQQVGALNDFAWRVKGSAECLWVTSNLIGQVPFDGRWHTMIGWWDGRNICPSGGGLYIDGVVPSMATLTGTTSGTTQITNDAPPCIAGSGQAGTDFTNGTIDDAYFVRGLMTPQKAKRIHDLFSMRNNND